MKCSTLECYSEAIAKSKISDSVYCVECAIKVVKQEGPSAIKTMANGKLPWKYPVEAQCPHCGVDYNRYLIGITGECPKCRKDLPEYKK